jgi:hypothetical protein
MDPALGSSRLVDELMRMVATQILSTTPCALWTGCGMILKFLSTCRVLHRSILLVFSLLQEELVGHGRKDFRKPGEEHKTVFEIYIGHYKFRVK